MNNLAIYYKNIEKDYDKMKEYYLMAIEKDNSTAMYNLGHYYQTIKINYDKMKKYYLMAIKKGHFNAMYNLKMKTSTLERYILYEQHNISFDEELTKDIHIYKNKLKISKNDTCGICMEDNKQCILLNCFFHYVCTGCYIKLYNKPCSFCRL